MRPLIGITMDSSERPDTYAVWTHYAAAVEAAGGLPVFVPYHGDKGLIPYYLTSCRGLLFSGGDDLNPSRYGETRHPETRELDPDREAFEFALLAAADALRLPVLAICLGCQVMNVHRGGKLVQFLPDVPRDNPLEHRRLEAKIRRHPVRIEPGSHLASAIGEEELLANTYHKQAVATVGKGLRVNAWAPDGVIEGIEDPSREFFLGVQWHPERLWQEERHLALFRALVVHAARR